MKSHKIIAQQFFEKANQIEKCLVSLKNEKLSEKTLREIKEIEEKYQRIQDHCIPIFTTATGQEFPHPSLFYFVFLYQELSVEYNETPQVLSKQAVNSQNGKDLEGITEISCMQHVLHLFPVERCHGLFCLRNIVVGIGHDANEHSFHHASIVRGGDNYLVGTGYA